MTGERTAESRKNGKRPVIYLDYQASTPTDARVVEAMLPFFTTRFGNPHSVDHAYGHAAEAAVDGARAKVASIIGAEAREIVFTSGATEANNLAVKGTARFAKRTGDKTHVVTCATEHKCVLESCRRLEGEGFRVTCLPVRENGLVDLEALATAITPETALVSIMAVNNEIGVIQPLAKIGALCRERGVTFHTDAAQAMGKVPLDVNASNIDLMSISGHKVYGPMGIGALYVRRRPRARLDALADGGGQERGLRSGTVPLPLAVGLGETAAIAEAEMAGEAARLVKLRDRLLRGLTARLDGVRVNGDLEARIPGNLNFAFEGVDGRALMAGVEGTIAVSMGSACTSSAVEPSYVLRALGLDPELAEASLRIGLGRFTTDDEIDVAVEAVVREVSRLRRSESMRKTA